MASYINIPPSVSTTIVTGTSATSLSLSNLDGDNDGNYKIVFDLTLALTAPRVVSLQINGLATNQTLFELTNVIGSITVQSVALLQIMNCIAATTRLFGWINLTSKSGLNRKMLSTAYSDRQQTNFSMGEWQVTTGNVTSLSIVSAEANSITSGSMAVTRLHESG